MVNLTTFCLFFGINLFAHILSHSNAFKIGILVPSHWKTSTGLTVQQLLYQAQETGQRFLGENSVLSLVWGCDICDEQQSMISAIKLYQQEQVDVFLAPFCAKAIHTVSLLTSYWTKPVMSWVPGTQSSTLEPTRPMLISISPGTDELQTMVTTLIQNQFKLTTLTVISDRSGDGPCYQTQWRIMDTFINLNIDTASKENITESLITANQHSAATLLCVSSDMLESIFLVAELVGMTSGSHVFLYYSLTLSIRQLNPNFVDTYSRFLPSIIQIVNHEVPDSKYQKVFQPNQHRLHHYKTDTVGNHTIQQTLNSNLDQLLPYLYDSVLLLSKTVGQRLRLGISGNISATDLYNSVRNRKMNDSNFLTTPLEFDHHGKRKSRFTVYHQQNGYLELIAMVSENYEEVAELVDWPGGSLPFEFNETQDIIGRIIGPVIGCLVTALCIILLLVFIYKYLSKKKESSPSWSVNGLDLKLKKDRGTKITPKLCSSINNNDDKNSGTVSRKCRLTRMETKATLGFGSGFSLDKTHLFAPIGQYRGSIVAIKPLHGRSIKLTDSTIEDLNIIKELQHDNINVFVGARLDDGTGYILYKYCAKGSLQDVLENDDIKLDWIFKMSFAIDIAKGMEYLHKCPLKSNGNLKSSNCVIDSRWVVKVTDFGALSASEHHVQNTTEYYKRLLWTAPELLRQKEVEKKGSPKGDVYSFAIILTEIFLRSMPFYYNNTSCEEIVKSVKGFKDLPVRPVIPADSSLKLELVDLIQSCWKEDPHQRPDFRSIRKQLININGGRKTNIMDNMIQLLEAYSNNLETLVTERTEELAQEKSKTERLLYQLLPQAVADQLKFGKSVVPETFKSVSIFFSDIVGFTHIASISEPLQVVDLLNDLYTTFDGIIDKHDVYKVETIGDAYMCVSGVPNRNGDRHSSEIANMALDLISAVHNFRIRHLPEEKLLLRVGLHTGSCAAGVVGQIMPRYCLFGDTVNMASRMESMGKALHIHMSSDMNDALRRLDEGFLTVQRGFIQVKGKGLQKTFWLVGKKSYHNPLPDSMLRFHHNKTSDSRPTSPSVKSLGFNDDGMYTGLLRKPSITTNTSSLSLTSITSDCCSDVINNELLSVDEPFRFEYNQGSGLGSGEVEKSDNIKMEIPRIELTHLP